MSLQTPASFCSDSSQRDAGSAADHRALPAALVANTRTHLPTNMYPPPPSFAEGVCAFPVADTPHVLTSTINMSRCTRTSCTAQVRVMLNVNSNVKQGGHNSLYCSRRYAIGVIWFNSISSSFFFSFFLFLGRILLLKGWTGR